MCLDNFSSESPSSKKVTTAQSNEVYRKVSRKMHWPEDPIPGVSFVSCLYRFYQRWTYSYMNTILDKGCRQTFDDGTHLCQDDLFPLPRTMESDLLSEKFREYYNQTKEAASGKKRLLSTLWHIASPMFIPAGLCQLLTVIAQVSVPLLVRELLTILEENPSQKVVSQGMPYAVGIFVALVANGFANHRHRHMAMKSGIMMRAALVNVIYDNVLRLTPSGRLGLTSGEVANLVAVDTQKIYEVAQDGHLIWSLPLSVLAVTIFLVLIMGPATLVGIGVLVLCVPLVQRVTSGMLAARQARVKMTDKRVEIINSMLQGIKVTKLNNYEENYHKRIKEVRNKEIAWLRTELAIFAITLVIMVVSPGLSAAATFTTYVLVDESNILTAAKTFSVLLLFSALRFPINYFGRLMGKAAQALSAAQRIAAFLEREVRERDIDMDSRKNGSDGVEPGPQLHLSRAAFSVEMTRRLSKTTLMDESSVNSGPVSFKVARFDLSVRKGEVLAVCGPVGSGKSTFVNGIIGEVPASPETVVVKNGSVALVPQTPFILNATLRENILFGRPFEPELYERVIDACCLRPDIEQLGTSGDLTEIGERGVTLSGGQKQRVSLARAAYARPDMVLLDDPLSALDAGTAKRVFHRLIKSLFSTTAVVLVTHAAHFLNRVDLILLIVDGENKFVGSWNELSSFEPSDSETRGAVEHILSSVQEASSNTSDEQQPDNEGARSDTEGVSKDGLMTIEDREHGLSSLGTWLLWFRHAGGIFYIMLLVLLLTIDRFTYVLVEWWLARWTGGANQPIVVFGIEFAPQTDGISAQYDYLVVYASILLVSTIATICRSEWSMTGGWRAAKKVFSSMLSSVLMAPMDYFETTPMGRVLNRFTFDTEVVDVLLTQNMSMFIISCSWYVAGVVLMAVILPWVLLAIVPITIIYGLLLLRYRMSGADLQRLDAVSRSPLQAMITEALDGISTIRVFHQQRTFLDRFHAKADLNGSALLCFVSAQRWLSIRIELLGSFVVLVSTVLVITLNDVLRLEPGIVGLLIIWSSNFTITLGFLVDTFAEAEAAITSIERVDAMQRLPAENSMETDKNHMLLSSWPEGGKLEFESVCLRYRKGLPLALNKLSFAIPAGKTCGIVGRTGAGKSSLTVALFRLVEIEAGRIILDGVDLGGLGLSDVRGRSNGMSIIPQDPFLAGATLRECLDPFGAHNDLEMLDALKAVRIAGRDSTNETLDMTVEEGGSNFSVGERQLLNLARALLSRPKLLVLDEATASIDGQTDAFIQRMLRTRFLGTTLVTIAHRLNTIMDYDMIVVMDAGEAVEVGSPAELLERNGVFAELVDATGPEGSKSLRALVVCSDP